MGQRQTERALESPLESETTDSLDLCAGGPGKGNITEGERTGQEGLQGKWGLGLSPNSVRHLPRERGARMGVDTDRASALGLGRGGAREKRQQPELLWVRWVCGRTGPLGQTDEK